MQEATDHTILGNFGGETFVKDGVKSTFFKKEGKFWARTDGPDGKLADFEVRYTFGVSPLQQYLIELPKGRLQALGIAWDARPKDEGGQRWFHLYPDRNLAAGNPLHWTGIDQNWNYQCAFCHSTNIKKGYDVTAGTFDTTWSEISVGCEACHGPASRHIAWATKTGDWRRFDAPGKGFTATLSEQKGIVWTMTPSGTAARSETRKTSDEIEMCATCHARRQQISDDFNQTRRFLDSFRPSVLEPSLYHVDGQQLDEVYTYGSFLQSRMHAAGVTCSDCHNPHTGKLRASGNAVCAQCHASETFDTPSHHHHTSDSVGNACASCHMPTTTYMVVDPRHDHSMRIPRPDRTHLLGTSNACNQCHTDKTAAWARDAIRSWNPSPRPGYQGFAEAFDLADHAAPGAQAALLRIAEDGSLPPIARASTIARLGQFPSPQALEVATKSLKSADASVRAAAVGLVAGADPETRRSLLVPLLRDDSRIVRMDAARALVGDAERQLSSEDRIPFDAALTQYIEAQLFNAERPESHANLGALFRDRGKRDESRAEFAKAIEIDPTFVAAAISLADLMRSEGQESAAEAVLRQSLAANPGSPPVTHALALSFIRQKRTAEAMVNLAEAARTAPEDPRFSYVYAIALHDTGKQTEAINVLKNALARHPYHRDILWALASYQAEIQDYASALSQAELLHELEPARPDVSQLLDALRRRPK
jgi:predicted CXXCH cytochrome family protein